jgi:hypothetical protein
MRNTPKSKKTRNRRRKSSHRANVFRGPGATSLQTILDRLDEQTLCMQAFRGAYVAQHRKLLAMVAASASVLAADEELFRQFVNLPFWKENPNGRPTLDDRPLAMKYLFRWNCGPGKAASKRSSRYYRALVLLGDLGTESEVWEAAIVEARGIKALARRAAAGHDQFKVEKEPARDQSPPWDEQVAVARNTATRKEKAKIEEAPSDAPPWKEVGNPKRKAEVELHKVAKAHGGTVVPLVFQGDLIAKFHELARQAEGTPINMRAMFTRAANGSVALVVENSILGEGVLLVEIDPGKLGDLLNNPGGTAATLSVNIDGYEDGWRSVNATDFDID